MATQRRQSTPRHPRSPLSRQVVVRKPLQRVQRPPAVPPPSPSKPPQGSN